MNRRGIGELACVVGLALLAGGCLTSKHEMKSLDLSGLDDDEGVFVMRVLTSGARVDDGVETREASADIDYWVHYGTTASQLGKVFTLSNFDTDYNVHVEGEEGVELVVRRLPEGEYFIDELGRSGYYDTPMAVRFSVTAGEITYIGDLCFEFVETDTWLGLSEYRRFRMDVASDLVAVRRALEERFAGGLPAIRTALMTVESPPLF